jgi:hypothetical protein
MQKSNEAVKNQPVGNEKDKADQPGQQQTNGEKKEQNKGGKDAMRSGQPEGPGSNRGRGNDQGQHSGPSKGGQG